MARGFKRVKERYRKDVANNLTWSQRVAQQPMIHDKIPSEPKGCIWLVIIFIQTLNYFA